MAACVRETSSLWLELRVRASSPNSAVLWGKQLAVEWFRPRRYRHFDHPVGESFARKVTSPSFVCTHSFSPLIHYFKEEKRYKRRDHKTRVKARPIMYASHRDACILSYYSSLLTDLLEEEYAQSGVGESAVAYRSLGKANYHFAAEVFAFAKENAPVAILAYDVTGFFDNLDHRLLKRQLRSILRCQNLPDDWYKVFRYITRFSYVTVDDLKAVPSIAKSMETDYERGPIATIATVKAEKVEIRRNPKALAGIPQGTPISAALSNLYMLEFDKALKQFCDDVGGIYRRYSDDILLVCAETHAVDAERMVVSMLSDLRLEISKDKTEITRFDVTADAPLSERAAQYLGFNLYPDGPGIRPSSLSRQWRKMRRSLRRTAKVAAAAISKGAATKVYTKRLRRRFTPLAFRNFSSYARRSARVFGGDEKITQQVRRFEKEVERQLRLLKEVEEVD